MTPQETLTRIADEAKDALTRANTTTEIDAVDVEYLGRKGLLTGLLRLVGSLPADERPTFGQAVNARKDELVAAIEAKRSDLAAHENRARLSADSVDITLPGTPAWVGGWHPLTRQMQA